MTLRRQRFNRQAQVLVAVVTAGSVACGPVSCRSSEVQGGPPGTIVSASEISAPMDGATRNLAQLLSGTKPGVFVSNAETVNRLDRLLSLAKSADALVPRDTFDPNAVVAAAGRDARKLAAWVREHTLLVPYHGVLRGPIGVLMDRKGNSLDRSLLLVKLLQSTGATSRLAHAQLTTDQARALWQESRAATPVAPPSMAGASNGKVIDEYAESSAVSSQAIRNGIQQAAAASDRAAESVRARIASQTAKLGKLTGVGSVKDEDAGKAVEVLRDHWWVQVQEGMTWTDLDPATSTPGTSIVTAGQTLEPEQVGADLYHDVEVRVVVEQWTGTEYREFRALNQRLRPLEVLGKNIELRQVPMNWPRAAKEVLGTPGLSGFRKAVLQEHEWLPTLVVGDKSFTQSSFTDKGDVNTTPGARAGGGAAGGLLDAFGAGPEVPRTQGVLTAEWIEYELRSPDMPVRVIRRQVFDLAGETSRKGRLAPANVTDADRWARGLSLLGTTEILPLGTMISSPFVAHLMSRQVMAAVPVLKGIVERSATLSGQDAIDAVAGVKPTGVRLYELAAARTQWSRAPERVYLSRPNVLTRHAFMAPDQSGGFHMAEAFDIVANEVDVRGPDPVLARLEQGVLDSNAEAVLMGSAASRGSAPDLFDAEAKNGPWVAVRSADEAGRLGFSQEISARIVQDVSAGYVVVAPKAPASADADTYRGWWRVDTRTGDTLAIGDRGWGQAMAEYSVTKAIVVAVALQLGCAAVVSIGNPNGLTLRMWLTCSVGSIGVMAAGFGYPLVAAAFGFVLATGIWGNDNPNLSRRVF